MNEPTTGCAEREGRGSGGAALANPQLPSTELPTAEEVDWEGLHPRFVRRMQAGVAVRASVAAGVLLAICLLVGQVSPEGMWSKVSAALLGWFPWMVSVPGFMAALFVAYWGLRLAARMWTPPGGQA